APGGLEWATRASTVQADAAQGTIHAARAHDATTTHCPTPPVDPPQSALGTDEATPQGVATDRLLARRSIGSRVSHAMLITSVDEPPRRTEDLSEPPLGASLVPTLLHPGPQPPRRAPPPRDPPSRSRRPHSARRAHRRPRPDRRRLRRRRRRAPPHPARPQHPRPRRRPR